MLPGPSASLGSPLMERADTAAWPPRDAAALEPVRSLEEPTMVPMVPRRSTLSERASRASKDCSFNLGLSLETIQASSRDAEEFPDGVGGGLFAADSACKARFRGWHTTEEGRHIPTSCEGSLRVMSYNLCASRYMTTDRYPQCPTWAMPDAYRSKQFSREIKGCDPDIIAFQEMSIDMFVLPDLLGDLLRKEGYEGHHVVITDKVGNVCHMGGSNGDDVRGEFEGVAIFYKGSRFTRIEDHPINFNRIAQTDRTLQPHERARVQIASHNVGLAVALQDRQGNNVHLAGTMHASWDAVQRPECQVYQMHHLIDAIEELKNMYDHIGDVSVLLLGDFNAELTSYPLNYALCNQLEALPAAAGSMPDGCEAPLTPAQVSGGSMAYGNVTTSPALTATTLGSPMQPIASLCTWPPSMFGDWIANPRSHSLVLHDAYASYAKKFPSKVSAVNPSAGGEGKLIDHILFDKRCLVCVAVGKLDGRQELPTKTVPSDHYPIAATFVPLHAVDFAQHPLVASDADEA